MTTHRDPAEMENVALSDELDQLRFSFIKAGMFKGWYQDETKQAIYDTHYARYVALRNEALKRQWAKITPAMRQATQAKNIELAQRSLAAVEDTRPMIGPIQKPGYLSHREAHKFDLAYRSGKLFENRVKYFKNAYRDMCEVLADTNVEPKPAKQVKRKKLTYKQLPLDW